MNKKMIRYRTAVKNIMKECKISETEFHRMMEKGEIKVSAMHPVLKKILPYRILKIHENGQIDGHFIQ